MEEEWKPIKDEDGYYVSNHGRVKNEKTGRFLKTNVNQNGYCYASFPVIKIKSVHRLVAEYFIPNPENKACVDHKNRNKNDNHASNLRWVSYSENGRNKTKCKNCTSFYFGVCFNKLTNKWVAQIAVNKKKICIGRFTTELKAAKAYDNYIIKNKLEFFNLNKCADIPQVKPPIKKKFSHFHGVYYNKTAKKWFSTIPLDKKRFHIGTFDTEFMAAIKYNQFIKDNGLQGYPINEFDFVFFPQVTTDQTQSCPN